MEETKPIQKIDLGPPPKELVVADFYDLLENVQLKTDETNRKLLLMQTIPGHANMADGKFRTHEDKIECTRYPNTTLDDVALILNGDKKLDMGIEEVREKRLENIMEIRDIMQRILKGERVNRLRNSKKEPLLGLPFLKNMEIKNPINIITGFYLGSIMDNYITWRRQLEKEPYNLNMGGGECVAVDMGKLNQETLDKIMRYDETLSIDFSRFSEGFHLGTLANEEWEGHIDALLEYGVVVDEKEAEATKYIKNAYVRHKKGKGVSDNAAIVMAGILYGQKDAQDGIETALGVYFADAVDTLDKYLPTIHKHGLDEAIGEEIRKSGKLNLTKKEKLNFIFFSAIHPKKKMPDCSQRYFLQIDSEDSGDTAIENHLTYLKGDEPKHMIFGHKAASVGVKSEDFYGTIEEQFEKYQNLL